MISSVVVVCVAGLASANEPEPPPPPVAPAALVTAEDTSLTSTLTVPPGATLGLRKGPRRGTATLDAATARLVFTPNKDFHGDDSIVIEVTVAGKRTNQTVPITVTPVNDHPVVDARALATNEDGATSARLTVRDVDSDRVSFSVGEPPASGTATVDDKGAVAFTPARDFNGQVVIGVVVDDGHGGIVRAPVTVRVAPVNDAPVATAASLDAAEDTAGTVVMAATDVDGDALSWSIATAPKNGRATVDKRGQLTLTPALNWHGKDSVVVAVKDTAGAIGTATVDVVVTPVNDVPVVARLTLALREDTGASAHLDAKDIDGDSLGFVVKEAPKKGTATVDDKGTVTYTPAANENGNDRFVVAVSDGKGGGVEAIVDVVIEPVNDKPRSENATLNVAEDGVLNATLTASDIDGDAVHFILFTPPTSGRAELTRAGALGYTPPRDWHGTDKLVVEVEDGKSWVRATITIVVEPVNDAPLTQPLSVTTDEDRVVKGNVVGRDIDGDRLRYEIRDAPAYGDAVVDASSGRVTYTPAKDRHGKDRFLVAVNDGTVEVVSAVDVVVAAMPDPPQTFADTLPAQEDTTSEGQLPAREPDGEKLTFALVGDAKLGAVTLLDKHSGRIRYVPGKNKNGADTIAFSATDNITVVNGTYSVAVAAVNDAPTALGASATTREDTPVDVTIVMADVDNDDAVVEIVGAVAGARVEVVDGKKGRLRVISDANKHGTISFQARAVEALASESVAVVVVVEPVNDAPTIKSSRFTMAEDSTLKASLVSADVDGDDLAYRLARAPTRGNVVVDAKTGAFGYTPRGDAFGKDSFTVVVKDTAGLESTGTADIDITPVDDEPIALDGRLRSPRAGRVTGTFVGRDPEGARIRYVVAAQPRLGRVEILDERSGSFAYTAEGGQRSGNTTFTFVVEAGGQRSTPATINVEID